MSHPDSTAPVNFEHAISLEEGSSGKPLVRGDRVEAQLPLQDACPQIIHSVLSALVVRASLGCQKNHCRRVGLLDLAGSCHDNGFIRKLCWYPGQALLWMAAPPALSPQVVGGKREGEGEGFAGGTRWGWVWGEGPLKSTGPPLGHSLFS